MSKAPKGRRVLEKATKVPLRAQENYWSNWLNKATFDIMDNGSPQRQLPSQSQRSKVVPQRQRDGGNHNSQDLQFKRAFKFQHGR